MSESTDDVELMSCDWCNKDYDAHDSELNGHYNVSHICIECQSEWAFQCNDCDDILHLDDAQWINWVGANVCEPCSESNYWWCNSCDTRIRNYHSCGCEDDHDEDDDGTIRSYSYKPDPKWFVKQLDTDTIVKTNRWEMIRETPFMGFELEVEAVDNGRYYLATSVLENNSNWLYCKEDGSLNDGFEIVSHPHSLAAFNLRDWSWIEMLSKEGAKSWHTGTCGLHVHINKSAFKNNSHIWRFTNLILYNRHQASRLAGRNDSQWASFHREYKQVGKILKGDLDPTRYTAVNLVNHSTIEVRMFRGSLHEPRVRAALEFVNANFEYTKPLTSYDVLKNDAMSWWSFTAWVERNQSTYPHLMHYLNKIKERSDRVSTLL